MSGSVQAFARPVESAAQPMELSIVIPTLGREQALLDTVSALLGLAARADELLVIDQSPSHDAATDHRLSQWQTQGAIRWIRLSEASIPAAMNTGLRSALGRRVLFLDDDINPDANLLAAHRQAAARGPGVLVAGRVFQPWDSRTGPWADPPDCFAADRPQAVQEFMGGNFSVDRERALALGGFDENFVRAAYRVEADFAARWRKGGASLWFCPSASIDHLKAGAGGTRTFGSHLRTAKPDHAVGAYYFALTHGAFGAVLARPLRAIRTRHHLTQPWFIPLTLLAELRGLVWAIRLWLAGPRLSRPAMGPEGGA